MSDYGCGGLGFYDCLCGGDLCVCENYGEIECPGCEDCEDTDGFEGQDEEDPSDAP